MLPKEILLAFLYSSGSCASHVHSGVTLDCADGSIFNSVRKVIDACHAPNPRYHGKSFVQQQIRMPTANECLARGQTFLSRAKFPANFPPIICQCMDGCHIEASFFTFKRLNWMTANQVGLNISTIVAICSNNVNEEFDVFFN